LHYFHFLGDYRSALSHNAMENMFNWSEYNEKLVRRGVLGWFEFCKGHSERAERDEQRKERQPIQIFCICIIHSHFPPYFLPSCSFTKTYWFKYRQSKPSV